MNNQLIANNEFEGPMFGSVGVERSRGLNNGSQADSLRPGRSALTDQSAISNTPHGQSVFNYTFNHSSFQSQPQRKRKNRMSQNKVPDSKICKTIQFKLNQTLKSIDSNCSKKSRGSGSSIKSRSQKPFNRFKKQQSASRERQGSNSDLNLQSLQYDSSIKQIQMNDDQGDDPRFSPISDQVHQYVEQPENGNPQPHPMVEKFGQPSEPNTGRIQEIFEDHLQPEISHGGQPSIMEEQFRKTFSNQNQSLSSKGNEMSFQKHYQQFENEELGFATQGMSVIEQDGMFEPCFLDNAERMAYPLGTTLRTFAGQSIGDSSGLQDAPELVDRNDEGMLINEQESNYQNCRMEEFRNQRQLGLKHKRLQSTELSSHEHLNFSSNPWSQVTTNAVNSPGCINHSGLRDLIQDDSDVFSQPSQPKKGVKKENKRANSGFTKVNHEELEYLNQIVQSQDEDNFKNKYFQQIQQAKFEQQSPSDQSGGQPMNFQNRADTQRLLSELSYTTAGMAGVSKDQNQTFQSNGVQVERQTMEGTIERIRQELLLMNTTGPSEESNQMQSFTPELQGADYQFGSDLQPIEENFDQEDQIQYDQIDKPNCYNEMDPNLSNVQESTDSPSQQHNVSIENIPLPYEQNNNSIIHCQPAISNGDSRNLQSKQGLNTQVNSKQEPCIRSSLYQQKQQEYITVQNYPSGQHPFLKGSSQKKGSRNQDLLSSASLQSPLSPVLAKFRPKNYEKYDKPVIRSTKLQHKRTTSQKRNHPKLVGIDNSTQSLRNTASLTQGSTNLPPHYGPILFSKQKAMNQQVKFCSSTYLPKQKYASPVTPIRSYSRRPRRKSLKRKKSLKKDNSQSCDLTRQQANQFSFPRERRGLLVNEEKQILEKQIQEQLKKERIKQILLDTSTCPKCKKVSYGSRSPPGKRSRSLNRNLFGPAQHKLQVHLSQESISLVKRKLSNTDLAGKNKLCWKCKRTRSASAKSRKRQSDHQLSFRAKKSSKRSSSYYSYKSKRNLTTTIKKKKKRSKSRKSRKSSTKRQVKDASTQIENSESSKLIPRNILQRKSSKHSSIRSSLQNSRHKVRDNSSSASTCQNCSNGICNLKLNVGKRPTSMISSTSKKTAKHSEGCLQIQKSMSLNSRQNVHSIIDRLNSDLNDQLDTSGCMPQRQSKDRRTLANQISVSQIQTAEDPMYNQKIRASYQTVAQQQEDPFYDYQSGVMMQYQNLMNPTASEGFGIGQQSVYPEYQSMEGDTHDLPFKAPGDEKNCYNPPDNYEFIEQSGLTTPDDRTLIPQPNINLPISPDINFNPQGFAVSTSPLEQNLESNGSKKLDCSMKNFRAMKGLLDPEQFKTLLESEEDPKDNVDLLFMRYNRIKQSGDLKARNDFFAQLGRKFFTAIDSSQHKKSRRNATYAAPTFSQIRKMRVSPSGQFSSSYAPQHQTVDDGSHPRSSEYSLSKKSMKSSRMHSFQNLPPSTDIKSSTCKRKSQSTVKIPKFEMVNQSPWQVNNFDPRRNQRERLNQSATYHSIQKKLFTLCDQSEVGSISSRQQTDGSIPFSASASQVYQLISQKQKEKQLLVKQTAWLRNRVVQVQRQSTNARDSNAITFEKFQESRQEQEIIKGKNLDVSLQKQDLERRIAQAEQDLIDASRIKQSLSSEIQQEKKLMAEIQLICANYKGLLSQRGGPKKENLTHLVHNSKKLMKNLEKKRDQLVLDIRNIYGDFKQTLVHQSPQQL